MPSKGRIWQELTWSWAYSTGHPASDQRMEAAAKAAWPYALLCAWTYLNDHDFAHDLMDHAIHNASEYAGRYPDPPSNKLTARIKSVIQRRAKQLAAKRSHEVSYGSLSDLEPIYFCQPEAEQRAIANEMFGHLSPFAQSIVNWRWFGYSWRQIGVQLEMHHTAVRRAYLRELESILQSSSRRGDSRPCD